MEDSDPERQLAAEQQLKYQGTAIVELEQISFDPLTDQEVDQKNVERLSKIFLQNGCERLNIRNHVTATIPRQFLDRVCRAAGLTLEQLKNLRQSPPRLDFSGVEVQCLHGRHRLKAAAEVLPHSDRWWTVDLYLDDISSDLRTILAEEYGNEKPPSDGEVYRKFRHYQRENNVLSQERWLLRLSDNKVRRIRQLDSHDNRRIRAALDELLPIPGLWDGLSIGSLNNVLALKCNEEIIHYFKHIKNFWATLVGHDSDKMARIDTYTVEKLQLHAPRASNNDKNHVEGKILSGEVFSSFSESERRIIRNKLMSAEACDGIIPSLATFFHDISYLKLCADAVKRLVRLDGKHPTVRGALVHYFRKRARGDTTCFIQTSESTFRRQLGSEEERLAMGYRQIWMYAMRHYPAMARDIKDEARSKMAQAKGEARPDEHVVYNMALLAEKLGFHTPQINVILEQSPDLQIAADALLRARKPAEYTYDDETMKRLMRKIARCFAHATPKEMRHVNTTTGQADKLHERRGAPPKAVQPLDCPHLFLDRLHSPIMRRNVLSSLEVRRSVYYAFFGKPPSRGDSSDPGSYSPLFFPNRASDVQPEASSRNVSRSSSGTRSLQDGQPRSDTREERRRRRHGRNNQERERGLHQQQQEVSQLFPSEGPLLRRSSAVPPVIYRDSLDTFDTEFQIRSQRNSQRPAAGEDNRTAREQRGLLEVYDDDLLHRTEDVSVRNLLDSEHEPMTALVPARPQEEGEEEEGLNSAMEKEHTQLYEDDISRDMQYEDSSAQSLDDAEHAPMTTLVPAQPQEEEEEGEEQEEEEEELNSSMEQEHTQLGEDDIPRDMQYEDSSAQSLDDAEHAPMTALVPARPQEKGQEEKAGLNSSMEQEHTQLGEDDIPRDMQYEDSSAQSLDDAEHAPMTTLVPAQPQEEEEEGEEQEEEEEELNSAMEQEHTQLDEMDISRDMQNEISSAQSLDDAEHAPMTALVPAPVGNEGNHSMMTATLQSQSGAIRSQAKTKKATWQPSQTTQSGIRKAYSKKKKARVQRATRINPASQDLRAAERTHPNASQSSWEHTEDEEARLVQEPRTAEGAPEGRSVAVVGQDGVLTSSNHIGGDQVSTLRDQTQDLESKRMNDQAASMLVDPLCPSTVVDGDVVMDDVQSEMLQDLSSEKFGRSANSGSSEEGARRPQTPQVPCKRKRDSYNRRPKKKHRRLWKKTNSRKFNLLRTSTPAVHGDIGDEATGQAPNEMEHQPAAKTSERISFPGGNTGKAISNNVQHQDPVLEQQEILVGRGSWQATQPSHGADESNSPQPIPAGPRAIQAEDQLADGKETLEGHNRDPERRSSQEREDGQLKPGRPSYERSEEDDSAQPMSADPPAIPSREQFVHDRETLDGQNEDFQSRIIQQRADALAQLQTPSASLDHVSTRPVTEILLDLPSLIKRFREDASQVDDGSVYGANIAVQDHPGQETARSPSVTGTDSEATITPSQRSTRDSDRYTDNAPSLDLSQQAIHRQQSEVRLFEAPPQVGESEDEEMEEAPGEPSPTPDTTPNNPRPLKAINEAPSALSNNRRTRQSVLITFYMWENKQGKWIVSDEVWVSPGNPTEAQRIAERHRGVDFYHFWNDELRRTLLQNCVREAIRDGTLAIFMRSGRSVRVTDPMNAAAVATMRGLSEE